MDSRIRILSTKTLTVPQRERLLNAGFALVETPMVKTREVPFTTPAIIEKAIFTSGNAVKAITDKSLELTKCFCVGEKTAAALQDLGFTPELTANSGAELAAMLVDRYPGEAFHFLNTRNRREELPLIFKDHHTPLIEIEVYETLTVPQKVPGSFDGILFFSPSAVNTYALENSFSGTACFSIGPTTADALKAHTNKVVVARKPTAGHLILETIKHFKNINAHNRETSI